MVTILLLDEAFIGNARKNNGKPAWSKTALRVNCWSGSIAEAPCAWPPG